MAKTITLILDVHAEARLMDALRIHETKWHRVAVDSLAGNNNCASPEGAKLLAQDTAELINQIEQQLIA